MGVAGFRNIHIFDQQVSTGMERRALIRLLDPPWWLSGRGGRGHGGKPVLHAKKALRSQRRQQISTDTILWVTTRPVLPDISVHKARAVRGPMISSRGIAARRLQHLEDFADMFSSAA